MNLDPGVYVQAFSKQVASWSAKSYGVSPSVVHVKTIAIFITHVQYLDDTLLSNRHRGKRL